MGDSPGKPLSCNGAFRSSFAGSGCPGCPQGRRQGRGRPLPPVRRILWPRPWLRLWIRIPLHMDTTAMDSTDTTERGVLMLSPRLILTSCTVATTAMDLDMDMATDTLMEPDTPTGDNL